MADEQQAEPFSGSELAELRDSLAGSGKVWYGDTWIMRLLATLEAMRPLVVALAGPGGLLTCNEDGYSCVFCESDDWMPEGRYADVRHTPDCPVTQARALKQRMGW